MATLRPKIAPKRPKTACSELFWGPYRPDMCETVTKHCPTCGSVDSWPFLQKLKQYPSCSKKLPERGLKRPVRNCFEARTSPISVKLLESIVLYVVQLIIIIFGSLITGRVPWASLTLFFIVSVTFTVPPQSVRHVHGTPLIDDNVTDVCYSTMY